MREICRDGEVIRLFSGRNTLRDSTVRKLSISAAGRTDEDPVAEVVLEMPPGRDFSSVLLRFAGVSGFTFHFDNRFVFYNVESVKLLAIETGYYLSLDPADESDTVSEEDEDVVCASNVVAFELP